MPKGQTNKSKALRDKFNAVKTKFNLGGKNQLNMKSELLSLKTEMENFTGTFNERDGLLLDLQAMLRDIENKDKSESEEVLSMLVVHQFNVFTHEFNLHRNHHKLLLQLLLLH
jgi:hypothetical protein